MSKSKGNAVESKNNYRFFPASWVDRPVFIVLGIGSEFDLIDLSKLLYSAQGTSLIAL